MRWVVVAVVAEAFVAIALVLAVSYMTSIETCHSTYGIRPLRESVLPNSPPTSTTCSRHFWWQ